MSWFDPFPIDLKYAMFTKENDKMDAVWYFNCKSSSNVWYKWFSQPDLCLKTKQL